MAIKTQNMQTAPLRDKPMGKIHASKTTVANSGDSITFTADAQPKDGAVEYVRYYLLNPTLGIKNDWGGPNWCSCGRVCSITDPCTLKTWDLGESGDAKRNYAITWGPETTSGISTQVSRNLSIVNTPPGEYDVYIQVKDTAGNLNEAADAVKIKVTAMTSVLGVQSPPQTRLTSCGRHEEASNLYSFAWEDASPGITVHYYQLDQGPWTPTYESGISLDVTPGEHLFAIQTMAGDSPVGVGSCRFTAQ